MKTGWSIILGVVMGLLGAGAILLASSPPRGNPIGLLPPPTPLPIQVYVNGEVANPGVYALPQESRVQDAIKAAGGLTAEADDQGLNLAAVLQDGTEIRIPSQIQIELPSQQAEESQKPEPAPTAVVKPQGSSLININTANQTELETLSGIGPVTAAKIIAYREENGPFTLIEEIQKVSGIGPATFEKIKPFITVEDAP